MGRCELTDFLEARAFELLRSGVLEYAEDFGRECRATLRDPEGHAALTFARQRAEADGRERGGQRCCGTTEAWHLPWCKTGPRRWRDGFDEVAYRAELYGTCEKCGTTRDDRPAPPASALTREYYCPECEGTAGDG